MIAMLHYTGCGYWLELTEGEASVRLEVSDSEAEQLNEMGIVIEYAIQ